MTRISPSIVTLPHMQLDVDVTLMSATTRSGRCRTQESSSASVQREGVIDGSRPRRSCASTAARVTFPNTGPRERRVKRGQWRGTIRTLPDRPPLAATATAPLISLRS